MMKKVLFPALLVVALLSIPATASAHVEMAPDRVPAGKPVKLTLEVGHGCGEAPTTKLMIRVPGEARNVKALNLSGWKGTVQGRSMTWTGGSLPSDQVLGFPVKATLFGKKGTVVQFKTIQSCPGGLQTAWIQEPAAGVEPENPTPQVILSSTAPVPSASADQQSDDQVAEEDAAATGEPTATDATAADSDDGGSGRSLLLIIVAGLAIGTIAGRIVRAHRSGR